jgi:hypothetical protein
MDSREMLFWEGSYSVAHRCGDASSQDLVTSVGESKTQASISALRPALALLLPLRIGPLQQILGAGTAQMRAAILHYHLTIDVAGLIGNQKARQIGKFAMLAGAAERIALRPAFIAPFGAELARSPGVGNAPGAIATVRTPLGPHSTARLRVIASTADFAIADGTVKARPVIVEVERMLSTTPLCLPSIQRLPAASVQYIVPCSVGARIASAARGDRCSVCAMKVAAALLTSTSIGASRQICFHHGIDRGSCRGYRS